MASLATEFPIKPIRDKSAFVAQVVAWLRGTNYSTVLDSPGDSDLEADTAVLRSQTGEELRLREFSRNGLEAIGFRHDFPDDAGRLWRTETVVRRGASGDGQDLIRLRTESIARQPGARLDSPRKPYLIKSILRDGWGGSDGGLCVTDEPLWLPDDEAGIELARAITCGEATRYLPAIYVSAIGSANWLISSSQIERLAFDLGGIAHVIAEPSRAFSFRLRDVTKGANAYGETLAIGLPSRGIVRRFYLGLRFPEIDHLLSVIRETSAAVRSQMPAEGWDWTELQEQALRQQRVRDRNRLTAEEAEQLYQEEIANLQDRVRQLEGQITAQSPTTDEFDDGFLPALVVKKLGPEIYPGEFSDRLRLAARECVARAEQIGLDRRSLVILRNVSELPTSPALSELLEDLARATKDPKSIASELTWLLSRHGYRKKSDNKHVRLEAMKDYSGLDTITLPKTPSDKRGVVNLRKQIERTLGIAKLSE